MEEKYIMNDILENVKANLKEYEDVIINSSNIEFRQTIQNLRNSEESFQYELYKLAESKGYYTSAESVENSQIQNLKKELM